MFTTTSPADHVALHTTTSASVFMSWLHMCAMCTTCLRPLPPPPFQVTLYRRTVRRQWYALKRKEDLSRCTFCGWVSGKNQFMGGVTGNTACTGQCMRGFEQQYPSEYKPPC